MTKYRFIARLMAVMMLVSLVLVGCNNPLKDDLQSDLQDELLEEEFCQDEDSKNVKNQDSLKEEGSEDCIMVQIYGAVNNPGVYELPQKSRMVDLIKKAGGFCQDAYEEGINQASYLEDAASYYVYTRQQWQEEKNASLEESPETDGQGKVNINTADKEKLMTLTGIGEVRADAIIKYRQDNGNFSSCEDLMKVEGIKEGTYNKIKDSIRVS